MPLAVLDHLILAAKTLEQGCDWLEATVGVRPQPGGAHALMGTHNALLRLGKRIYLEVIAVDPSAPPPARPRWWDLDSPTLQATLSEEPRLLHWVVRVSDLQAASRAYNIDVGTSLAMSRNAWQWSITVRPDGSLPGDGLLPSLIRWDGFHHPADTLFDNDVSLVAIAGQHPSPASIRAGLARLQLNEILPVTYDRSPRLAALLRTPRGTVAL